MHVNTRAGSPAPRAHRHGTRVCTAAGRPTLWGRPSSEVKATATAPAAAHWRQVFDILDQALELTPEERAAYVERACGGDRALGADVAALLAGADAATFLEAPAADFAAPLLGDRTADVDRTESGSTIGAYRILRELGRGGMGAVHLAERADNQYRRRVALKVLPGWSAANERLVRRFVEERQILAALDHPDIARLFDGGVTAEGLPWFAMEYVEGAPIDHCCDQRRLPIEERLELFCRVCAAVQYAHRNLVVHRDLKPANILVTPEGRVKLLDFGIAKLLGSDGVDASLTMTGERLMTPLYASPEQVRGNPITTASDVYSLGVLLHELLTGRYPYRLTTREPHAVARAILEQEPERPSVAVLRPLEVSEHTGPTTTPERVAFARGMTPAKLARRLRGDLDTIVATAMQKDPARRYGSAEQLEADVRRHLAGLPLTARPESRLSRARKFARRHRVGVAVTAGVAVLVVAFAVVSSVQAVRIRAQAARIALERDRAEQVSTFLAGLFRTSDPYAGAGSALTAREILDSGAARIDRELVDQPRARAQMLFEMGRAYFGLGVRDRARRFVETSLAIRRRASPEGRLEIAQTLDFLGVVLREEGELDAAERAYREALTIRRQLLGAEHRDVARTLNGLAGLLRAAGRFRVADSVSRAAVAIDKKRPGQNALDLAESLEGLAHSVHERGGFAAAEQLYRRVLTLRRQAFGEEHPEVGRSFVHLAAAVGDAGQDVLADSLFRRGLALERRLLGSDHPDVAAGEAAHARLLRRRGNDAEAESLYREALTIARRRLPAVHALTAAILLGLGELELDRGAPERAEPLLREALAMRRATLPPEHPHSAEAEQLVGAAVLARRRYGEAERYLLPSHGQLREAYGDDDPRTRTARRRLVALYEASRQPSQVARYREPSGRDEATAAPVSRSAPIAARRPIANIFGVSAFRPVSRDPALTDLRDWFQDLMSARLTGDELAPVLSPATRYSLIGEITGTSQRLALEARLVTLPRGSVRTEVRLEGPADSLPHLADRLATRLLASVASETGEDTGALAATSLPALRAHLAGRTAFRLGRWDEARSYFERAVWLDSTFALPSLWLAAAGALQQNPQGADERWKYDAAWRQRDRLGPAGRALLVAHLGPRYPSAPTLVELVAAGEEAARVAPGWAEAWFIAGENLERFGSLVGYPDSKTRAVAAYRQAHALDPTHIPTLDRLLVLAAAFGDREAVRRYAELYFAHSSEAEATDFPRWSTALALGDSAAVAEVRSRLANLPAMDLFRIAVWSQRHAVGLEDGIRAADLLLRRAVSGRERRVATLRVVPSLLNRGRPAEANRVLAAFELGFGRSQSVGGVREFQVYAALYWDGDSSAAAVAARRLEAYLGGAPMGPGEVGDRETASCALAHWRVGAGDLRGARMALTWMRRRTPPAGARATMASPVCAAAAEAQLEATRDSASGAIALARLDSLLRGTSNFRDQMVTVGSLIAARLHETRGEIRLSLDLVRRRSVWNMYLSTQLREEGRLAALSGDRAGALRAYRHYLALRGDPEPALRPEVERVRAELERLERDHTPGSPR
ncbi:MAG: tetratricopeptide repeat protein [Gemmatimonadaceae bacterium]